MLPFVPEGNNKKNHPPQGMVFSYQIIYEDSFADMRKFHRSHCRSQWHTNTKRLYFFSE